MTTVIAVIVITAAVILFAVTGYAIYRSLSSPEEE